MSLDKIKISIDKNANVGRMSAGKYYWTVLDIFVTSVYFC